MRPESLLGLIGSALSDDVVVMGFVALFDRAEEAKMAELEK